MKKINFIFLITLVLTVMSCQQRGSKCLQYVFDGDNAIVSGIIPCPEDDSTNIVIPEMVKQDGRKYKVTKIGKRAFGGCRYITSITIPSSVISIDESAFGGCTGLTSITIPSSVINIGYGAFCDCSNLSSITLPNSLTSIGERAFLRCGSLSSITLPNSLTNIGNEAFWECTSLASIIIPNSVKKIGGAAFFECSSLTSVTLQSSVIGHDAFFHCSSLSSITLTDDVNEIESGAFSWCNLKSIKIPSSVSYIGNAIFGLCTDLEIIEVDKNNTKYDSRDNCNAIIETATNTLINGCPKSTIPNTVTSIGREAFQDCTNLSSIIIPNSVSSIGICAFTGCTNLRSITIPNTVTSIGIRVFEGCSNLTLKIPEKFREQEYLGVNDCKNVIYY